MHRHTLHLNIWPTIWPPPCPLPRAILAGSHATLGLGLYYLQESSGILFVVA